MGPPVCVQQTENSAEDSKRAADHYRLVCIPHFLDRWHILTEDVRGKWTWMRGERARRAARDQDTTP